VAIVTGAGRGIGKGIALALGAAGCHVVVNYAKSAEAAEEVAAELRDAGVDAVCAQGDVADGDDADGLVAAAFARFGRIDVLVNNAGITRDVTLKRMSREHFDAVMDTNLGSVYNMARAVLPYMLEARFGRIISISSFVGQKGNFGQTNYAASKSAIIGWTKAAALELATAGITVNAVCPGFIETSMFDGVPDDVKERLIEQIPMRRLGEPEEVADGVVYLAGADYVTGQALNINGGIYM
jgi:acetoacetyl-CoA reductase